MLNRIAKVSAIITVVIIMAVIAIAFGSYVTLSGKAASVTQCSDRVDNDGDGRCDYTSGRPCTDGSIKGDSGCSSKSDNTEASCVTGSTTCGVGACQRSSTCVNDVVSCTPGSPITEVCGNGIDDDCNGVVDNGCTTCSDTDGGFITTVQGTVSGITVNGTYSNTDSCITNTTLREYYCGGNQAYSGTWNCGGNQTTLCSNGACI